MSSVTVACCVRSPSATVCSSFISRRIAAWLASLTRLASCSWRSASWRCSFGRAASGRVWSSTNSAQQPEAAAGQQQQRQQQRRPAAAPPKPAASARPRCSWSRPRRSGSLSATIADLRLARRHQALQVAEDGAGLRARSARTARAAAAAARASAGRACRAGAVRHCRRAAPCAISRNAFRSLPSRNTGLRADAFGRQEFVGALADALRQHHQLADRRQLGRRRACLQLERRHGLGGLQQVGRLAVDRAQRLADLGQRLLLAEHDAGVLLGAVDQRQQRVERRRCSAGRRRRQRGRRRCCRLRTLRASTSLLSLTSAKAGGCPTSACDTDLASRCDCVVAWPAAATCARCGCWRSAPAQPPTSSSASRPTTKTSASTRCWRASGQPPIDRQSAGDGASGARVVAGAIRRSRRPARTARPPR